MYVCMYVCMYVYITENIICNEDVLYVMKFISIKFSSDADIKFSVIDTIDNLNQKSCKKSMNGKWSQISIQQKFHKLITY